MTVKGDLESLLISKYGVTTEKAYDIVASIFQALSEADYVNAYYKHMYPNGADQETHALISADYFDVINFLRTLSIKEPYMIIAPMVADFYHGDNTPNFEKLQKEGGIQGIFHKCTDGTTFVDPAYTARINLVKSLGLLPGAYHFMEDEDVNAQVELFLKHAGTGVRLALDWEEPVKGKSATKEMALQFLTEVQKQTGQTPWLYGGELLKSQELPEEFAQFPLWLSEYGPKAKVPKPWSSFTLWQYTETGKVAKDLSTFNGTPQQLKVVWWDTVQGVPSA